jgi:Ca2+-binding RTX toxin-like protein
MASLLAAVVATALPGAAPAQAPVLPGQSELQAALDGLARALAPPPKATPTQPKAALNPGPCANPRRGTSGADRLVGTRAGDLIRGGTGDDVVRGKRGADCLRGQGGNDQLDGGKGSDDLSGGTGLDTLTGGSGRDSFRSGSGNDFIGARDGRRETVRCGGGTDLVVADRKDRVRGCEVRR